jgi:hypothetical protein
MQSHLKWGSHESLLSKRPRILTDGTNGRALLQHFKETERNTVCSKEYHGQQNATLGGWRGTWARPSTSPSSSETAQPRTTSVATHGGAAGWGPHFDSSGNSTTLWRTETAISLRSAAFSVPIGPRGPAMGRTLRRHPTRSRTRAWRYLQDLQARQLKGQTSLTTAGRDLHDIQTLRCSAGHRPDLQEHVQRYTAVRMRLLYVAVTKGWPVALYYDGQRWVSRRPGRLLERFPNPAQSCPVSVPGPGTPDNSPGAEQAEVRSGHGQELPSEEDDIAVRDTSPSWDRTGSASSVNFPDFDEALRQCCTGINFHKLFISTYLFVCM